MKDQMRAMGRAVRERVAYTASSKLRLSGEGFQSNYLARNQDGTVQVLSYGRRVTGLSFACQLKKNAIVVGISYPLNDAKEIEKAKNFLAGTIPPAELAVLKAASAEYQAKRAQANLTKTQQEIASQAVVSGESTEEDIEIPSAPATIGVPTAKKHTVDEINAAKALVEAGEAPDLKTAFGLLG